MDSIGGGSLRELLHQPPAEIRNHKGKKFMWAAGIWQLLSHEKISAWIENHPLHRPSDIGAHRQDLVQRIMDGSRLLFAILVAAELEFLTADLLSRDQSDASLPNIDYHSLSLNPDEQRRLNDICYHSALVLRQNPHLYLSQKTVLPFTSRESINKRGSFGQLFRVKVAKGHLKGYNKSIVAEKSQRLDRLEDEKSYLREVETLRKRKHPNIVPLLASYTMNTTESAYDVRYLHFIFPLAEMDLHDWMMCSPPPPWVQKLSRQEIRAYLYRSIYGLVSGLSFLHREKDGEITAHHDLKPKNILVFGEELKIADFGRSHLRPLAEGSETQGASGLGTYDYHPPEYWKDDGSRAELKHGRAFDVWSMGCIIFELATLLVHGWEAKKVTDFRHLRQKNPHRRRPKLPPDHSEDESFHNNWNVVKKWVDQLQVDDGTPKLKSTLNVALEMMNESRGSRLYAWEAELDLYNIQHPDDDRVTRLEKGGLQVQRPPVHGKILNGTQTPLHRAAQKGDLERLCQLDKHGWSLYIRDHEGLTAWDVSNRDQTPSFCEALRARLAPNTSKEAAYEEQGQKLLEAAGSGNVNLVRSLLAQEADVMFLDKRNCSALYRAAENNHIHVAECLLQAEGKQLLRQKDSRWGDTPLHRAASMGHAAMIKKLLEYSPDIEDRQIQGKTALFLAVECGNGEIVDILLNHGAQAIPPKDDFRGTPLHPAEGHSNTVNLLPESKPPALIDAPGRHYGFDLMAAADFLFKGAGVHILHKAAIHNMIDLAEHCLDRGCQIDMITTEGPSYPRRFDFAHEMTPLGYACAEGHVDMVDFLLSRGAPYELDKPHSAPLWTAAHQGHARVVDLLLTRFKAKHGKEKVNQLLLKRPHPKSGHPILFTAASSGKPDAVRVLLDHGATYEANWFNATPLVATATYGCPEVTELLLEYHKNDKIDIQIDRQANHGRTALIEACLNNYQRIEKMLLDAGANHTITDNGGATALHVSTNSNNDNLSRLLVEKAASEGHRQRFLDFINIRHEGSGRTALIDCVERTRPASFRMLLEHGANYELAGFLGDNPLLIAAQFGHNGMIETLFKRVKSDHETEPQKFQEYINRQNIDAKTAVYIACESNQPSTVRLLLEAGADYTITNKSDQTLLNAACWNGHKAVVEVVLDLLFKNASSNEASKFLNHRNDKTATDRISSSVSIKSRFYSFLNHASSSNKRTALCDVACQSFTHLARKLLEAGADWDCPDDEGRTPAHWACRNRNGEMYRMLVAAAGLGAVGRKENTKVEERKIMEEKFYDRRDKDGESVSMAALRNGIIKKNRSAE